MSRTPISILQEMMVKKQKMPTYELILNSGGTHINTFVYEVSCDGLKATGRGRSKKDAKHEAAKAMLEAIAAQRGYPQLPASPAESPVRTPLLTKVPEPLKLQPGEPFLNAVGNLQTLCTDNDLAPPEYELISDVGPAHAKTFTTRCKVATYVEIGIAKTKKQAKQVAAKKMLDRLTELIPKCNSQDEDQPQRNDNPVPKNDDPPQINIDQMRKDDIETDEMARRNEIAKIRFLALARLPKKINMGLKISEFHLKFKNSFEPDVQQDLLEKLVALDSTTEMNDPTADDLKELTRNFQAILTSINLEMIPIDIPTKATVKNCFVVSVRVNSSPNIVQMAMDKSRTRAEFYAIQATIKSMIIFLK